MGQQPRYLIGDRDRSYSGAFIGKARAIGIKTVLTAVRAPKANATAERVVGTLRRECLDHLISGDEAELTYTIPMPAGGVTRERAAVPDFVQSGPTRLDKIENLRPEVPFGAVAA